MPTAISTSPRNLIRLGFFTALGVAILYVLAVFVEHLSKAVISIATPFVVGTALALLMDPVVDRLERRGLSRLGGVALVFGLFLFFTVSLTYLIVPALVDQASGLATNAPANISKIHDMVDTFLKSHRKIGPIKLPNNFTSYDKIMGGVSSKAAEVLQQSAGNVASFLLGSITTILQLVVSLIVTFYMLVDIDRLRARFFFLLPEKRRATVGEVATDIGGVFAGYLRGLLIVCALYGAATMGLLYAMSIKHGEIAQYALLVGAAAGVLYAVPYIGALSTALVTFIVAFAAGGFSFGCWGIVFTLILNQVFDNVITPRVVGGGVGLHPVASLFALTLGGELFGLWGLLLSVPVAASIQVILLRVFPKLSEPTPAPFLRAQGVRVTESSQTSQILGKEPSEEEKPKE
ncbi:AI-2E family transporter [Capsulimonas corticalis]|uniref:AI-2E family transporter n=1 Tax=Capsulimonas corticalis TaxID=2219043 RepID=A0A402CXC5_9BACT|nr:AI-2E family transporter [Capsulimonas corticalis]BDI32326.1 AI-2E family transporter [Capsulimonas corticalis]